jgi:hypothetical protein
VCLVLVPALPKTKQIASPVCHVILTIGANCISSASILNNLKITQKVNFIQISVPCSRIIPLSQRIKRKTKDLSISIFIF